MPPAGTSGSRMDAAAWSGLWGGWGGSLVIPAPSAQDKPTVTG